MDASTSVSETDCAISRPSRRGSRSQKSEKKEKWTTFHFSAFFITFFGYAMFHATRKTFSNVKGTMAQEWSPYNDSLPDVLDYQTWNSHRLFEKKDDADYYFGTLDTVFMLAYSMGLYISGALGDRFDLRKVLSYGMWSSAIAVFIFGTVTEWLNYHHYYFYIFMWIIAGLLQSSGWPSVVAIVGNWFGKSSRGFIMGLWGACPSVGNIIGSYTVSMVLHYGYEYAFLVPASMMFAFGVISFFGLVSSPKDVGLPESEEKTESETQEDTARLLRDVQTECTSDEESLKVNSVAPNNAKAIGFFRAFLLPGVLPYSVAYACLKLVNYSFFFWLPFYLEKQYNWTEEDADSLSTWYDVGGIAGSILGGIITDKLPSRSPVVAIMLILGPPSLFIYNVSPDNKVINALLMSIAGFFIGGAANLISTTISADLGKQKEFSGNKEALATVTGIIDGTGSLGAAIGQLVIPAIERSIGWNYVFYLFMIMMILTLVCILPIVYRDTKATWHHFRANRIASIVNTRID